MPRATPRTSLERWKTVIASAAIVSGCYVASSNRNGTHASGFAFGGRGWLFDPTGTLMAETTPESPVVCGRVDPARAERAQREYPCYVEDLPAPSPDDTPRRGAPAP